MYTQTQNHGENTSQNNTELIEREKIEGTPFTLIKQNEKWFITMGDFRLTEPTKTKQEAILKMTNEKWMFIMHMIFIATTKVLENEKTAQKLTEKLKK